MTNTTAIKTVHDLNELTAALAQGENQTIEIAATVIAPHTLFLSPGTLLQGSKDGQGLLAFATGGLGLTRNNSVSNLTIIAPANERAIFLMAGTVDVGTLKLKNLKVTGQVGLIARTGTTRMRVEAEAVHVLACDARHYLEQPQKYGVNVLQGAFTIYNFNPEEGSQVTAKLIEISVGQENAPVLGSGIFISGFNDDKGLVALEELTTGTVYSLGLLTAGTADFITAAVFIVYGVHAQKVTNEKPVITYGVNDMVLDNWGTVDEWTAKDTILSHGPSGIGFVNFGTVKTFKAQDVITKGKGARGYNQYDGTVDDISFKSVTTFGDGSVGIQISTPIKRLSITGDLITHGAVGDSLVKGVNMKLAAMALSIKSTGAIEEVIIGGNIITHGDKVDAYVVDGGKVGKITLGGKIIAQGKDAKSIVVENGGKSGEQA